LPEAQRRRLGSYLTECAAAAPDFRWAPAPNLHLTLRFLGHIEASIGDGIADRLGGSAPAGFELELGSVGTFQRGRLVRVVWLGLRRGADQARALAAEVEVACTEAGLAAEARAFQPHLTLARARARDGAVLPALASPPQLPAWRADELVLYRSRLGRGGSVYEPLRVLRLS
jgi:RNA 2',3'-cyclic 3'-phosphodiesterase